MAKKFLLVDDDTDDKELFCEALGEVDASITCDYATDGYEALNKLKTGRGSLPDIIFLDINMPEMDGWQCLTKIKNSSSYKDIPVIMYSTSSHKKLSEIAKDLGALLFFTKPNDYDKLKTIIGAIVDHFNGNSLERINASLTI
jgi:CheY-like chemotaxis protein